METMEDPDESGPSPSLGPLFICEDSGDSALALTELTHSPLMKPYLQEMDELLQSCEELTGLAFGSRFSETDATQPTLSDDEHAPLGGGETSHSAYLSTYIDTHMDKAGTQEQEGQAQSRGMSSIMDVDLPLTSAGHKLSDSMVEYEGQLLGMFAMLDNCEPTDAMQEYVHINKHLCIRGNTVTTAPVQQVKNESQTITSRNSIGHNVSGDAVSQEDGRLREVALKVEGTQMDPFERVQRSGLQTEDEQGAPDSNLRFLMSLVLSAATQNEPMFCKAAGQGCTAANKMTGGDGGLIEIELDDNEFPSEEQSLQKSDGFDGWCEINQLGALGSQIEECIEELQRLEQRRKELLLEVLELRGNKEREEEAVAGETIEDVSYKVSELLVTLKKEEESRRDEMRRERENLKNERAEEERRLWKVNLERHGLQEELRKLKRKLFCTARDCAQSKAAHQNRHLEVELLRKDQENLQSLELQVTEERSQIRSAHEQKLAELQAVLHAQSASRTSDTKEEMSRCKRHSCGDIQQYMQSGLRSLEDRYEPLLMALLKRKEAIAVSLAKAKEDAQEMKAQLAPLKGEIIKLEFQRACLEEKLKLGLLQRREDAGQYKEAVRSLEESRRKLRTELAIQKRKKQEVEELRDALTKQILSYRSIGCERKSPQGGSE